MLFPWLPNNPKAKVKQALYESRIASVTPKAVRLAFGRLRNGDNVRPAVFCQFSPAKKQPFVSYRRQAAINTINSGLFPSTSDLRNMSIWKIESFGKPTLSARPHIQHIAVAGAEFLDPAQPRLGIGAFSFTIDRYQRRLDVRLHLA